MDTTALVVARKVTTVENTFAMTKRCMESAKKALTIPAPLYVAKTKSGLVMVGSSQNAVKTGATMAESKCESCQCSILGYFVWILNDFFKCSPTLG